MTRFLTLFTIFLCLTFEALAQDKGVLHLCITELMKINHPW